MTIRETGLDNKLDLQNEVWFLIWIIIIIAL